MSTSLPHSGPALVLAVGPAASGKSTLLRRLLDDGVLDAVVATDRVRAELDLAPDETATAYRVARERVAAALADGAVVAVDATGLRVEDRAAWQDLARSCGATASVALRVGAGLGLAELLARDASRDRHVPPDAIAEHLAQFRASGPDVLAAEGWTVVDARELVPAPHQAPALAS